MCLIRHFPRKVNCFFRKTNARWVSFLIDFEKKLCFISLVFENL